MALENFSLKSLFLALILLHALPSQAAAPYCLFGDPCFPSDAQLEQFNATVNGRLIKIIPYGAACYEATYNADVCKELATVKPDIFYRQALPAGLMYTNWEQDGVNNSGCVVPDLPADGSAPPPVETQCVLGGMSAYVVNATCADAIATAVKFAAQYNLRFRIKNSGHDYTGRSSGAGSLSVWTLYMNDTTLETNFQACPNSVASDVLSAGPGVDVEQLYAWGGQNERVTIGGFTPTVGAAGGYTLGGGTGPLGPLFGLAVDNAVQFEIVTADGEQQTANECTNPDLYWALRGGGGAFAVVTRLYLKTYAPFTAVNAVAGTVQCGNWSSYSALIDTMVDLQVPLRNAGNAGIWESSNALLNMAVVQVLPFTNNSIQSANDTLAAYGPIMTIPGCQPALQAAQFLGPSSWNDAYQGVILPGISAGGKVGVNLADFSRIITYDMMSAPAKVQEIKNFILNLDPSAPFIWQNAVGAATSEIASNATAVQPEWRSAFAFFDIPTFGPWQGITSEQIQFAQAVLNNATTTFGTAAYYNEDYGLEKSWQQSFFGANYERLLQIKDQVDPNRVFNCRQCVGSEGGF